MIVIPKRDFVEEKGHNVPTVTLTRGKKYFVFAIESDRGGVGYYVIDNDDLYYPIKYKRELFDILDESRPSDWVTSFKGFGPFKRTLSSFPVWAEDAGRSGHPGFYERLLNSDEADKERRVFNDLKAQYENADTVR